MHNNNVRLYVNYLAAGNYHVSVGTYLVVFYSLTMHWLPLCFTYAKILEQESQNQQYRYVTALFTYTLILVLEMTLDNLFIDTLLILFYV